MGKQGYEVRACGLSGGMKSIEKLEKSGKDGDISSIKTMRKTKVLLVSCR